MRTVCRKLIRALEYTPYSRSEFEFAQQTTTEPVEAARRFVVRQRQSYGGRGERWSFCIKDAHAGMSSAIRRWHSGIDQLPAVHSRFRAVQIECADWRVVLDWYDSKATLSFLDPPYHPHTRIGGEYEHELSPSDHSELVERLLTSRGMVVLSGYDHQTYRRLERYGWKRIDHDVPAYSSEKRTRRLECLWLSPSVVNPKHRTKTFLSAAERMRAGPHAFAVPDGKSACLGQ
jgi:DNA adenine methylase